jgi:leucyl aminopeptidase (aminopeptidase T)
VPFTAELMGCDFRLARDAEVISPLGVALALVRDVVERTIVAPTPDDIVRVRREAIERVVASGADPALVEAVVEIDARRNLVRATASGATAGAAARGELLVANDDVRRAAAARALRAEVASLSLAVATEAFEVFVVARTARHDACAVDRSGTVRLIARDALVRRTSAAHALAALERLLDEATSFGDVGRALPEVHLVYATRVADLGAPADAAQLLALAGEELRGLAPDLPVVAVAAKRSA